ncbi:type II toxin-antitoxin system RelE/ParE family toxin [Capnocytophaga canis]|uniref:Plasmid maintenance system killer protein n=1 Tax=Capnocytophaga canis TaxID=1848903 RepID=A0A0B7INV1_9FLAO|nr:type II toxin-antitoxin system RelE/ParE family toxin [Capnocytophaga canis]CEN51663.1 Plasmid maintenance system killer protein [Capnocytophaga canis]
MQIEFIDEELARFYEGGKVKNKELKSNGNLQKLFIKTVDRLKSLEKIEDAFLFKSLNYEKLQGNLSGKSSVRVDIKYRIIFEEIEDEEGKVVILSIEELSNHYQ